MIRVENLGKKYVIGHQAEGASYVALRDVLAEGAKSLVRRFTGRGGSQRETREEFWALKDVSFEVKRGECVGIIGRNGAGKSTLLKILSRITEPTTGQIKIRGRVASLLEVGTGFHPELTGRENIFLNGSILGMSRAEIKLKFDEIVDFAEVERFLDTPVKFYSSGMYVRLAFAVAAHLEPEILVVDEVLAVGDAAFQKKCLGKMGDVAEREGRTVLFVSHNMPTITSLCQNAILLEHGKIVQKGIASLVVNQYYSDRESSMSSVDFSRENKTIDGKYAMLLSASVIDYENQICSEILINQSFKIIMRFRILENSTYIPVPTFDFHTSSGIYAFGSSPEKKPIKLEIGDYTYECHMPANFLNEGVYFVTLNLYSFTPFHILHFCEKNALTFNIKDPIEGTRNYDYAGAIAGVVRPKFQGEVTKIS